MPGAGADVSANASDAASALRLAGIGTWRREIGRKEVQWDPLMHVIFGQPPSFHPTPDSVFSLIHSDDQAAVRQAAQRLEQGEVAAEMEYRIRRPDGEVRWVRARGLSQTDGQGRVRAVLGTLQDITDARQAQERFRSFFDSAADALVVVDRSGAIRMANPMVQDVFGYRPDEVLGRPVEELVPPRYRGGHLEDRAAYHKDPTARPMGSGRELFGLRKDGTEVPVEISLSPFSHGDLVLATVRDITDRRRLEKLRGEAAEKEREAQRLRELNEFKARFINVAAHELKTPLTPMKIQLELLRGVYKAGLTEEHRRCLDVLGRNLDRMNGLVEDVLQAARLQANSLRLQLRPMDAAPVLGDVVESFSEAARQVGVRLTAKVQGELPIEADAGRIEQVVTNLVTNALKFTPQGGMVQISGRRDGANVVLEVSDSGIGMDDKQLAAIFQPFSQVHEDPALRRRGTGLGLYIAKGIVDQQGGSIQARSPGPGRGTTFTVRLPATSKPVPPAVPRGRPVSDEKRFRELI